MKKLSVLFGAAFVAVIMTGCAGVATNNGGVAPVAMGANFYSDVKANAIIQNIVLRTNI